MTRTKKALSLILVATLATGCQSPRKASSASSAVDSLFYEPHGEFDDPGSSRIGDRGPGPGGGYSESIGSTFGKAEAAEVYRRLVALEANGEFKQFTCGDSTPHIRFDLTLVPEGEYQERLVTVGHTPDPKPMGADRCLMSGLHYLVSRSFAEVDTGPSMDYGYKNPTNGETYPPQEPGKRHSRWWPTCHCEMSRDDPEWVTNGPEETSVGAQAQ